MCGRQRARERMWICGRIFWDNITMDDVVTKDTKERKGLNFSCASVLFVASIRLIAGSRRSDGARDQVGVAAAAGDGLTRKGLMAGRNRVVIQFGSLVSCRRVTFHLGERIFSSSSRA